MGKEQPKRYEIDSFDKLVNVINEENFESLTTDLVMWLGYNVQIMKGIREAEPELCKDKTNSEIAKNSFIWIDDGAHDCLSITIKNDNTGEVTTHKFADKS